MSFFGSDIAFLMLISNCNSLDLENLFRNLTEDNVYIKMTKLHLIHKVFLIWIDKANMEVTLS